jgi:hypothetical protein
MANPRDHQHAHYSDLVLTLCPATKRQDFPRGIQYLHYMKKLTCLFVAFGSIFSTYAQSSVEDELVAEGTALYKREMASWHGTDIFLERFSEKRARIGGYLSYLSGEKGICVFFSNEENPKVIGTITFDNSYDVKTAQVDGVDRDPSAEERDLITIRQIAMTELTTDKMFKFYKDTNPNAIPVIDEKGKRVYILTGPTQRDVVLFGNDYLLTFNKNNKLDNKRALHKSLITIPYGKTEDDKLISSTMHTHLPEFDELITATDICTLMMYSKYTNWEQHLVLSNKKVSWFNCRSNQLITMSKEAWDKLGK